MPLFVSRTPCLTLHSNDSIASPADPLEKPDAAVQVPIHDKMEAMLRL